MDMKFKVSETYAEILSDLNETSFSTFMQSFFNGDRTAHLFLLDANKEQIIKRFVDQFTSTTSLKNLPDYLPNDELKALRRIIRNNGFLPESNKHFPERSTIDGLRAKRLAFEVKVADSAGIVVPLEICLGLPFDHDGNERSLLMAMNRYSSDIIKLMASHLGIYNYAKMNKVSLAAVVYKTILENQVRFSQELTDLQKKVFRIIFKFHGVATNKELAAWGASHGMKEAKNQRNWYSGNSFLNYLGSGPDRNVDYLSEIEKALLVPVLRGLACVSFRVKYDDYWHYFIPSEVFSLLAEDFFREMDEKRIAIESKMFADAPDSYVSYSGRIAEDIIKVQIASACGLVEFIKTSLEFKKKSIADLSTMLNADEHYMARLLLLVGYHPGGLNSINYDAIDLLRTHILSQKFNIALLPSLKPLREWMHMDHLVHYLLNHRSLYLHTTSQETNHVENLLQEFYLLGLVDISPDGKKVRVTELVSALLEAHSVKPAAPIKGDSKPLLSQPNLELLIPYNADVKILRKLSEFSDLTVLDRMLHYSLTKKSLMRGLDKGWDVKAVLPFLSSICAKDIPKTVQIFIETSLSKQGEALVMLSSTLIRCKGLGLKEKILSIKGLKAEALEGTEDYLSLNEVSPEDALRILKKNGVFAEISAENNRMSVGYGKSVGEMHKQRT